ncbi:P-loop containing nucleoside triphosphate hydrolase protein [Mycena rosella]|uniref:P-loop containing nucleoside triphosphate hydrolase protein n=1 Tax=Mycena rosella TaxID=1033263 RepID=A0AAD7G9Z1_MYCRO|nr:P-loop containing nucleoside triphosphate hydrolase protein [Mycena rosella]
MAADQKAKISVYTKRNSNSIAAPIEIDSDSDFNTGPVAVEVKKKTKTKTKTKRKSAKRPPSDESTDSDSDGSDRPRAKKRRTTRERPKTNPLLEFFGDMDLHSDSSDDERDRTEDDSMEGPSYEVDEAAVSRRTVPTPSDPSGDTSTTEDDDEFKPSQKPASKVAARKPASKAPAPPPSGESSVTEDEPEPSQKPVSKRALPPKLASKRTPPPKRVPVRPPGAEEDTPTDDSDIEMPLTPPSRLYAAEDKPLPGFPLSLDQRELGPMILDKAQGIKVPGPINTYLREYQRQGVRFFWERYNEGRGGLLGDDMGLVRGLVCKTIQVISFLSAIMKKTGLKTDRKRRRKHVSRLQDGSNWRNHKTLPPANAKWPACLIIAPSTVVMNWEREFKTWGYFEVGSYVGKRDERKVVLSDFKKGRYDVVLTSLDLARRDIALLEDLPWSCVIVDEVHTVKNPASKTSKAYNSFECVRRFGLTGTAIQNSYDELWTILDWTSPGKVGERSQWRGFISKPLTLGQSAKATDGERLKSVKVSQIFTNEFLPRFFLRRTKMIIAHQLPKKTDEVVFCPLTPVQIRVYKKILNMPEVKYMLLRDEPCECGSEKKVKKCCHPFEAATIFKFMSILIKLSNHLGLLLPTPGDTPDQLIRNRQWASTAFPDGDAPAFGPAVMKRRYCGKWTVLQSLLKNWRADPTNKILIFTKTVKLLEVLSFHLKDEGYGFLQLDGSTKQTDRMPMIDQFHQDPDITVFLISTMAGGTGLNLTGANKVIIFDPNWNPAHDLQAMDRAFRFGQTRDVSVYRLLGAGSVEELIYARQVYKQQQMKIGYEASIQTRYFAGVQGDKSKQGELFGLANIFKLHEGGLATKMTIEKAHLAELDWALASMEAPKGARRESEIDVHEIETKLDKEYGDLKGLGALLFDDGPPPASAQDKAKAKATRGMYTHENADLLVASKIEQERTKEIAQQKKRRKSRKSAPDEDEGSSGKAWPPPRVHGKNRAPEERLKQRMAALIGTGMISHPDEYTKFAKDFGAYTREERAYTFNILDNYRADSDNETPTHGNSGGDGAKPMELEPEDIDS